MQPAKRSGWRKMRDLREPTPRQARMDCFQTFCPPTTDCSLRHSSIGERRQDGHDSRINVTRAERHGERIASRRGCYLEDLRRRPDKRPDDYQLRGQLRIDNRCNGCALREYWRYADCGDDRSRVSSHADKAVRSSRTRFVAGWKPVVRVSHLHDTKSSHYQYQKERAPSAEVLTIELAY